MRKIYIEVGQRFGRLVFVNDVEPIKRSFGTQRRSIFKCDCGKEKIFFTHDVRGGKTNSCGCLHKEQLSKLSTTHGLSQTKIYRVWSAMHDRCYREKDRSYKNYGGRGIRVHKSWHTFINFYNDMFPTYKEGLELDRANNNKGYSKNNCRWVTRSVNSKNKRQSIVFHGEHCDEASIRLGGNKSMISQRVRKLRWSLEKAFSTPVICQK